ncbi:hypothetical protein CYLTODRAFT_436760 [Cylindrobasidium torrendii FP15055 ss-10]|uniref:GST N-terminal domain-containing protein n=1 Tax=Cylindrobasidium torrendii FP15055 ss-10 TaxID=1314674 RepID=A0A0D7BCJ9_9AGAR|nr:hypothetical protein CYLTODRAFT_436760 [Cylindrobasidium torrendii FP15055 ss-10]
MNPALTLYDAFAEHIPGYSFSPSVWKIRYVLNYKKLEHKTEWIEFADIKTVYTQNGIAATEKKPDGSPHYTVPILHDAETKTFLSGSENIALYLDAKYPATPVVLPKSQVTLTRALEDAFLSKIGPSFWALFGPRTPSILTKKGAEWYQRTKLTRPAKELMLHGEARKEKLEELERCFGKIGEWFVEGATFVAGETPCFADFVLSSVLMSMKVGWATKEDWEVIQTWHGGRWNALVKALAEFEQVY